MLTQTDFEWCRGIGLGFVFLIEINKTASDSADQDQTARIFKRKTMDLRERKG